MSEFRYVFGNIEMPFHVFVNENSAVIYDMDRVICNYDENLGVRLPEDMAAKKDRMIAEKEKAAKA